jgi:MFS family permease
MSPLEYVEVDKGEEFWNLGDKITKRVTKSLRQVITRDFNINRGDVIILLLESLIFVNTLAYWLFMLDVTFSSEISFNDPQKTTIYVLAALTVLGGGTVIDLFSKRRNFFEILAIATICGMIFVNYVPILSAKFIGGITITITGFLMAIAFFTDMIAKTTLLNRARSVAFVAFVMAIAAAPVITAINTYASYDWVWTIVLGFTILLVISRKRVPLEVVIGEIRDLDILTIQNLRTTIKQSETLPYLYFLALTSTAFGFYVSHLLDKGFTNFTIWLVVLVAIISLPVIGLLLDNVGRKPMVYMAMLAIGTLSIFFDYSTNEQYRLVFEHVQIGVYTAAGLLILVLAPVIAGDSSSTFSRGRIMALFLFALVMGIIIGSQLQRELLAEDEYSQNDLVQISDWASFLLFVSLILVSKAREPFKEETPYWRNFIDKLYVLSNTGIGLYSYDFKNPLSNQQSLNEDLVSGGISGIQSMLKEISHSQKNIRVLDHGDLKLIFQYGDYSMSVLFAEKDLVVYREKLAAFHQRFEFQNQKNLANFRGNVSKLLGVDELRDIYFK